MTFDVLPEASILTSVKRKYSFTKVISNTLSGKIIKCKEDKDVRIMKLIVKSKLPSLKKYSAEDPLKEYEILQNLETQSGSVISLASPDFLEDETHAAFFLEYCPRGDVLELFTKQKNLLSQEIINSWIHSLAEGLKILHDQKVCHLDISLENLLIDRSFGLKITDFGQARKFEPGVLMKVENGVRPGKDSYRAPELQACQDFYGDKADVWSFGVCMFILLVGHPGFNVAWKQDRRFLKIFNRDFSDLLEYWGKPNVINAEEMKLLQSIFCSAEIRTSIDHVVNVTKSMYIPPTAGQDMETC